jgi:hypothetical protein
MIQRIRSIWRPAVYQGFGRKRDYFEGWYFKSVTADERSACAVIPGVSITGDPATTHAFIQFSDAGTGRAFYVRYPISAFEADRKRFDVRLGPNRFGLEGIRLDAADGTHTVRGELRFRGIHPWPVRVFSPGVMGPYAFTPSMECYHGVLSFDHRIEGTLTIDGGDIDFTGGKGYLEKDWGASFPAAWIWMQTNHFEQDGVSFFGSIAKIPWRNHFFTGSIFGLYRNGKIHRFTTYTGARVRELRADPDRIVLRIEDRRYGLLIEADRREGVELAAPRLGEMSTKIRETLRARISVRLTEGPTDGGRTIFAGTGRNGGLEFVGEIAELLRGLKVKP